MAISGDAIKQAQAAQNTMNETVMSTLSGIQGQQAELMRTAIANNESLNERMQIANDRYGNDQKMEAAQFEGQKAAVEAQMEKLRKMIRARTSDESGSVEPEGGKKSKNNDAGTPS